MAETAQRSLGRYLFLALGLAVVVAAAYLIVQLVATPPETLDLSRSKTSADGLYQVSIEPETEPVPQGDLHSWVLTLESAEGTPVPDADIAVDGGMPDHGHGLPTAPQATRMGDGRYRIEGVRFNMRGWWVLRLAISSPEGDDEVEFNLTL